MKTKLLTLLLLFALGSHAQQNIAAKQFATITGLRLAGATNGTIVNVSGLITANDKNGGNYYWNSSSTANDDGINIIKVTNVTTGRWMKMTNDNTIKGSATFNGTILQTAYNVSFGQTLPAIPAMIIIQPYSANAAVPSWVSNVTTTGFTVNFASVPVLGTNNISVSYLIIKN